MMTMIPSGIHLAALGFALALALPAGDALAGGQVTHCAKRETVATGSSIFHQRLAKIDAEIAWEIKAVKKYGLLWYSWWAANNNRFRCKTTGQHNIHICVARGTPCRLL